MQTDVDKPVWPNVNTTYEIFILILAVISFIGIILVYFSPVEDGVKRILLLVDTGICFVFLFDFGRNLISTQMPGVQCLNQPQLDLPRFG